MVQCFKILPLLFIPILSIAQFKKIKSFEVSEVITAVAIDRPGDIYLTTDQGQIQKFSEDGILRTVHKTNPSPTLFDPRDGAHLFAFYRNSHSYAFLTPTFDFLASYQIDSAFVIEPWLMCTSGEADLWLIESADGSLKKINPKAGEVKVDVKLDPSLHTANIMSMREYQGFVFILAKGTGIIIYSNLGKLIRTIEGEEINSFNFLGEELYYLIDGKLQFFDLFTAETRSVKLPTLCNFALASDERLFMISGKSVDIYDFKL